MEIRTEKPAIHVKIPAGADRLGFVLVAVRPERTVVSRVIVPLQPMSAGREGNNADGG